MTEQFKILTIKRTHYRNDGTFGVLDFEGVPFAVTIELPWKNNVINFSCIPDGEYVCIRTIHKGKYESWRVTDVPNREAINFHIANTMDDLRGCIGVGECFEKKDDLTAVLMSRVGFAEFMEKTRGIEKFRLIIKNCE